MTPKTKKILALTLLVGVGVVWVPQILAASTAGAPPPLPEIPAEGPASAVDDPPATTVDDLDHVAADRFRATQAGAASTATGPGEDTALGQEHDDLGRSLQASVAKAQRILPEQTGLDLDKLANSWSAPRTVTSEQALVPERPQFTATEGEQSGLAPLLEVAPSANPIDAFLAAHPLRGTMISDKQRVAFLGPLSVRIGDEPVPGLVVKGIESGYVHFAHESGSVRWNLIPFQVRAVTSLTSSTPESASAGGGAAGAGQPASVPVSTGSVMDPLNKLMPLLNEAAAQSAGTAVPGPAETRVGTSNRTAPAKEKNGS